MLVALWPFAFIKCMYVCIKFQLSIYVRSIVVGPASVLVVDVDAASQRPRRTVPAGVRVQSRRRQQDSDRRLRPIQHAGRGTHLVDAVDAARPSKRGRTGRRLDRVDSTWTADNFRSLSAVLQRRARRLGRQERTESLPELGPDDDGRSHGPAPGNK